MATANSAGTKKTAATSQRRTAPRASKAVYSQASEPDIPQSVRADRPRQTKTTTKKTTYTEPDIPQSVRAKPTQRTQAARQAMQQANYVYDDLDIPTARSQSQAQRSQPRPNQTRSQSTSRPSTNQRRQTTQATGTPNRGPSARPTNQKTQQNARRSPNKKNPSKPSNNNAKRVPSKPKAKRPGALAWLVALLACGGLGWFIWQLMRLDILPTGLFVLICALLIGVMGLLVFVWLFHTRRTVFKTIMAVLVCLIGLGSFIGGGYLKDTDKMFSQITNLTDKQANTMTVFAMQESDIVLPKQLTSDMKVGIDPSEDAQGTQGAIEQLQQAGRFSNRTLCHLLRFSRCVIQS